MLEDAGAVHGIERLLVFCKPGQVGLIVFVAISIHQQSYPLILRTMSSALMRLSELTSLSLAIACRANELTFQPVTIARTFSFSLLTVSIVDFGEKGHIKDSREDLPLFPRLGRIRCIADATGGGALQPPGPLRVVLLRRDELTSEGLFQEKGLDVFVAVQDVESVDGVVLPLKS